MSDRKKTHKIEIVLPLLTVLSDAVSVIASFIISYWLRFYSPFSDLFPPEKGIPQIEGYLFFILATIPVWVLTFQSFKMYRLNRVTFVFDEFFQIVKCVSIGILITLGILFFFREFPYSRIVFIIIWIISIVLVTIGRYVLLKLEKTIYNTGKGLKNVAIVGTDDLAVKIYEKFNRDTFTGYLVLGYFSKHGSELMHGGKLHLGNYDDLPSIIRELDIHKLFISLSPSDHNDLYEILKKCEGINVEFLLVPDYTELVTSRLKVLEIDGFPFMRVKSMPLNEWNRIVKRIFDILFSLAFLFVFSPVLIVISLLVKLTSPGPLFYKQERVGLDGKKFLMLKFRSMKIDAEKDGPQYAKKDDDRYTKIGRFIRKYSLDELPQYLNVLKGEMSVVGPRPEREYFINIMKESIDKYLERHRVKCGVTGWAQVNGLRGADTSMQERINYDIYYIENWSLAFDIKIIAKTIKEMFFSKTAF